MMVDDSDSVKCNESIIASRTPFHCVWGYDYDGDDKMKVNTTLDSTDCIKC